MYDLRRRQNIRLYLEISPHSPQRQHIAAMSMKTTYTTLLLVISELGMKELEGQRRWEKHPRKYRKVG